MAILPEIEEIAATIARQTASSDDPSVLHRPGLRLWRITARTVPEPNLYDPTLCILAQGAKRVHLDSKATQLYDPGHYLLSTMTVPARAEVVEASPGKPLLALVIDLDIQMLSQLVVEVGEDIPCGRGSPGPALVTAPIDPLFARTLLRLLQVAESDADWRILSSGLLRELHYLVLCGPAGSVLRDRVERHGSMERVARAVRFIEEHFSESLKVEAIARSAGLSASALHIRFKEATGLSPMQFAKRLRLHRAHGLLVAGETVARSAFEVGYVSPSQFSREFRRQFGMTPVAARAKSRGHEAPSVRGKPVRSPASNV